MWDGIRELNNPLPRWWVWTFYACILWAVGYAIAYPAIPMLTSATTGTLGYSSRGDVKAELAAAAEAQSALVEGVKAKTVAEILADDKLREFAVAAGGASFKVNCIQCHGSGAQGSVGFPNLNDDDWLWGGKPEQIEQTILHGIRFAGDPDTRISEMAVLRRDPRPHPDGAGRRLCCRASRVPRRTRRWWHPVRRSSSPTAPHAMATTGRATRSSARRNLTDAIWLRDRARPPSPRRSRRPSTA